MNPTIWHANCSIVRPFDEQLSPATNQEAHGMYDPFAPAILWTLVGIQFLGILSALLSRLGEGSSGQARCQCVFLFCLTLVGATTIVSLLLGPGSWLMSAATLSAMVLIALYDCGSASASHTVL